MATRAGSPRLRYGSHHKEIHSKKHPQLQELLCQAAGKEQHRRIPLVGGNSSHSCISVQDLFMPLEIKPNMTQAERSATTLIPTLTIPASLSNSSPLKYYFSHFSSKISQIRFLGRELDKVIYRCIWATQGQTQHWSYFKNSYREGPVLSTGWAEQLLIQESGIATLRGSPRNNTRSMELSTTAQETSSKARL